MQRKPILIAVIVTGMLITSAPAAQANETELASDVLDTLTVEPQTDDYNAADDRPDDWAQANDNPGDYSTTRDTILARDMTDVTYNDKHQVATGTLHDPYTGTTINFKRGQTTSNAVQIDHVVAFGEAWESGLGDDDEQTIERYYNDPYVLLAVDGPSNNGKQDSDAAEWLPSKVDADGKDTYDRYYVARQIAVKDKYDLSVDKDEKNAMSDVLATCPAQTIPDEQDGAYWENDTPSTGLAGDVNGDGKYTPSDLNGIQIVSDDGPLDLDTEWTTHRLDSLPANIRIEGLPDGWTSVPEDRSDPDRGYEILLLPVNDPTGDVVARYALLNAKAFDTADVNGNGRIDFDDLTGIRFIVDGEPYQQFDPDTLHYALPNGMEHTIRVENVPDVWEAIETPKSDGQGGESVSWAFIAPSRAEWVTYTFTWNTNTDTGDDTDMNVDDDTHTNAPSTPSDGGDTTKTPTDQLASTGATITGIGAFTLAILCCGAALGVLLRHRTRN